MHHQQQHQLRNRLELLADDVGRLRRQLDRISDHVEALTGMVEPTAAELAATTAPGSNDVVDEAIRVVDARHRALHHRLGTKRS